MFYTKCCGGCVSPAASDASLERALHIILICTADAIGTTPLPIKTKSKTYMDHHTSLQGYQCIFGVICGDDAGMHFVSS
jgi:hypothetical protein